MVTYTALNKNFEKLMQRDKDLKAQSILEVDERI